MQAQWTFNTVEGDRTLYIGKEANTSDSYVSVSDVLNIANYEVIVVINNLLITK